MNGPNTKLEVLEASSAQTKQELVQLFQLALAIANEHPSDPSLLDEVNAVLQGNLNSSPLYGQYPELEEINDELLGYEDLEIVLKDHGKVQAALRGWHTYVNTVPAKLDSILPEESD